MLLSRDGLHRGFQGWLWWWGTASRGYARSSCDTLQDAVSAVLCQSRGMDSARVTERRCGAARTDAFADNHLCHVLAQKLRLPPPCLLHGLELSRLRTREAPSVNGMADAVAQPIWRPLFTGLKLSMDGKWSMIEDVEKTVLIAGTDGTELLARVAAASV